MKSRLAIASPVALLCLCFMSYLPLHAQEQPRRIRGTIERVDGDKLVVKARDGSEVTLTLKKDAMVLAIVKATLSDIKPGSYVGITGKPQPDGSQRAVEVHIFPEAMRGVGDGHRPWDLLPESTMTNGNVEQQVTGVDEQTLKIKYKDGEKSIAVPAGTEIVTYQTGDRQELKPGAKIFVNGAVKQPDGSYEVARINYGKDGLTPPM
jgi:hypothetical protein